MYLGTKYHFEKVAKYETVNWFELNSNEKAPVKTIINKLKKKFMVFKKNNEKCYNSGRQYVST